MGTLTVNATNGQTVAAGASYTVSYPAGKSAADYLATGAKITTSDGSIYSATVSLGGSGITITNPTGRAIASGGFDYLDLDNAGIVARFNSLGEVDVLLGPKSTEASLVSSEKNLLTGENEISAAGIRIPIPKEGNSCVILGDSITGYYNLPLTIASLTRSANVCTATITAHGLVDQQEIRVYGVENDTTFNGVVTITRADANTITFPSVGADGTAAGSVLKAYNRQQTSDQGWASWANMLLGGRLKVLNNAAVGGATIDMLQSNLSSDVLAYVPQYVFVMAGINNLTGSDTPAQVITKLQTLYQSILATGSKVVALTILPLGSGYPSYATYAYKIPIVNDWIKRYAQQTNGMMLVDAYSVIIDPVHATAGAALTGMLFDNLHPAAKGAYTIGKAVKAALQNILLPISTLVSSNGDNFGANAANANVLDNGIWTATGGTTGANVSGVVASGWVVETTNAATTVVASVPARADGIGYDQQAVITVGGAHQVIMRNNIAARLAAGSSYQIECEIAVSGVSGSNLAALQSYINGTGYSATLNLGITNALSLTTFPTEDFTITLKSEVFTAPTSGYTLGNFYAVARFSAVGTALTMKVGRVSVRKIT